jgi:ribosome biogenesis GTPase
MQQRTQHFKLRRISMIELQTYGWRDSLLPEGSEGLLARVTAVYRERYELVCVCGTTFGRLKTSVYYRQGADFPTVGDFVLLDYQPGETT